MAQVRATADLVSALMAEARIESAEDLHFVQVKCPLLTGERMADAAAAGRASARRTRINRWATRAGRRRSGWRSRRARWPRARSPMR